MPTEAKTVAKTAEDDKIKCIISLRKMLSDDEKLNILQSDDTYLERYLYAADFSSHTAFKRMKLFYNLLEESPEWFSAKSPLEKRDFMETEMRILTPVYDKEGRRVYIVKIGKMNAKTMSLLDDVVPVDDFFMEFLLQDPDECKNGLCVIIDISHFPWNLIRWLTPANIKRGIKRIQSMPIKDYRYHIVNNSLPIHAAINILWPFLPSQIKDGVKFHFNDLDSLHEHIDPEVLPPEYGGTSVLDYRKYHKEIFDKNDEMLHSFNINRKKYLEKIESNADN